MRRRREAYEGGPPVVHLSRRTVARRAERARRKEQVRLWEDEAEQHGDPLDWKGWHTFRPGEHSSRERHIAGCRLLDCGPGWRGIPPYGPAPLPMERYNQAAYRNALLVGLLGNETPAEDGVHYSRPQLDKAWARVLALTGLDP